MVYSRVISRNLKLGCMDKCLEGGVTKCEAKVYIKIIKKRIQLLFVGGGGVVSQLGVYNTPPPRGIEVHTYR